MTSDHEAWIIASLSKISKNIFEFGTCSGKTTYIMGLNSNDETKITANLMGPLIINPKNHEVVQVVISDTSYSHQHNVLETS